MHALNPPSRLREVIDPDDGPFVELPPPQPKRWPGVLLAVGLLLLTAAGGFLRFYRLDRPLVWGDEASTYRRVCGTYGQMLDTLERDPFTPLFYSFEWALRSWGQVLLTPFWLRFLPALAGTLMVPAMYFLARQLVSVRTALIATVLTCTSSWLINYSRDAKMYMPFWLFVVLTAGCFFWWLRKRTWTSWLCWIAAGCAMMGLNVWGGVLMALLPAFLLTARRVHWAMGLAFILGSAVIVSGTVGYYTLFNSYVDKAEDRGGYEGISWAEWRNQGADGLDMVRDSASAFLYSFTFQQENFPDNFRNPERRLIPPKPVLVAAIAALAGIGLLMGLGALPWRKADIPPPASMPEPWWRSAMWVTLWLAASTYLFYCMSFGRADAPVTWLWAVDSFFAGRWWLFALTTIAAAWLITRWKPAGTLLLTAIVLVVLGLGGWAFLQHYTTPVADEHKWYRPIGAITQWLIQLRERPVVWPIAVFVGGIAIARSAPTWKRRGGHLLAAVLVTAAVFGVLVGVYLASEAVKTDLRARGIRLTSMWVPRYLGFIWPALAIALAATLARLPTWPLRWTAVAAVVALNLFVAHHRVLDHTEAPLDRVMADIALDTRGSDTRTYVPQMQVSGGPGATQWWTMTGPYYLLQVKPDLSHTPTWLLRPQHWYQHHGFNIRTNDNFRELISQSRDPKVNRLIVWRAQSNPDTPLRGGTELVSRLAGTWKLASEEIVPVRYHWCWATRYLYVRREYVRL